MSNANVIDTLKAILLIVWAFDGVKFITLGVILNLALAVALALRTGTFSFQALADFLFKQLLPYVVVYVFFKLFGEGAGFEWVGVAVFALIQVQIVSAIVEKLADLGVPIPDQVMRLVRRPNTVLYAQVAAPYSTVPTPPRPAVIE
ncbi:MAG: phage holin family protein [Anaerolineae bacterium]|nr:phage holin family protein [Anaerolineae bacterium]